MSVISARAVRLCALMMSGSLLASQAVAQDAAVGDQSGVGLEEIVVTAQKRSENLQSTPLAVSAITSATIEARGISDVSNLTAIAPGLTVTTTGSSTANIALFIRGIGESETIMTVDAPVGIYVDGVVLGRSSGAVFDMVDLERIEVLRGPQGTLYGRNTIGGAVNLISKQPADAFGIDQTFSYGRFDYFQSKTSMDTGEFGESGLRARFTYLHKQRDGYVNNTLTRGGRDPGAYNVEAFRAQLNYDQGGALRANYAFDYNNRVSVANPFQLADALPYVRDYLNASPALGGNAPEISRDRLNTLTLDRDGKIRDKTRSHTLNVELDVTPDIMLRSLTGYRKWTNSVVNDLDGNGGLVGLVAGPGILGGGPLDLEGVQPINLFNLTFDRDQHQWTQEVNLIGKIGDKVDFVLGAFYFDEVAHEQNPTFLTIIIPAGGPLPAAPGVSVESFGINLGSNTVYRFASKSKAVFGQVTGHLTDKLSVTGGLRYTKDTRQLDQSVPLSRSLHSSFDKLNWAATLDYQWNRDILTYARVATGYKAGGFNARSVNDGFKPENLTSYELGLKSELFDRRLRLNAAVYHANHKDVQVSQFLAGSGGSAGITVNAGKAVYTGIEAEFTALIADGFTIDGNVGYIDRKYKRFDIRNPATDQIVDISDSARFTYSTSTTANIGAEYRFAPSDIGRLSARLDYSYRGRMYWHSSALLNAFNDQISDGPVGRFDGRLTLSEIKAGGTDLQISLWGKNLTNEDYLLGGVDFGSLGFATVGYAEPRTFGIDLRAKF